MTSAKCAALLGVTPLMLAARYGRTETMAVLLRAKANVNARAGDGGNALHIAAAHLQLEARVKLADGRRRRAAAAAPPLPPVEDERPDGLAEGPLPILAVRVARREGGEVDAFGQQERAAVESDRSLRLLLTAVQLTSVLTPGARRGQE